MMKKPMLLGLAAILASGAFASVLSPEEALQRAIHQNGARKIITMQQAQPRLAYTATTEAGQPAVYVFNNPGGGSLILSASDVALPVLGYTDSGVIDPANMPPQLQAWLDEYASQIAYAEQNGLQPIDKNVTLTYPTDWEYIAPLVKTEWDQGKPYNLLTPQQTPTGCVATAMAQVMNYWKYPEIGHGAISYTNDINGALTMNFEQQPFAWDDMIDNYTSMSYTQKQADAVAYLMKACGYSSQMAYSGGGSGTQVEKASLALIKYFGYNKNIQSLQRYQFSMTEWATILYNQLKNVGPVIYSGHSLGNYAHAFVADGYDGNGYFHINWGWGGMCDGFYSLDALIPTSQGTGGSSYGGYNFSQGMVINIDPTNGDLTYEPAKELTLLGNVSATNASIMFTFDLTSANPGNIVNTSVTKIKPQFGVCFENLDSGEKSYTDANVSFYFQYSYWRTEDCPEMGPGSYIMWPTRFLARFPSTLPDGNYKVQLVWRNNSVGDWQLPISANGYHTYVNVKKTGTNFDIENLPIDHLVIDKAEVVTPLYMRSPCKIQFTVTNPSDTELSQSIVPVLYYDGKLSFEGDSQVVTVAPKSTITTTLLYTFGNTISGGTAPTTTTPREYTLGAYDNDMLNEYGYAMKLLDDAYYGDLGKVTMYRSATNATLRMRSITINNAEETSQEGYGKVYGVGNFSNIKLGITVDAYLGFIASPLTAVVYEFDPNEGPSGSNVRTVYEKTFDNMIFLPAGEVATEEVSLDMRGFYDVSKVYSATVFYVNNSSRKALGSVKFAASSGVENATLGTSDLTLLFNGYEIEASSEQGLANVAVYDLGGKVVETLDCRGASEASIPVASLSKGIYLVRALDAEGNVKTLKINR